MTSGLYIGHCLHIRKADEAHSLNIDFRPWADAAGKKKSDPISVLHVAVGVFVRTCTGTCTVLHAPSLLGIVLNLAEIRALGKMFDQ